jgi:hypothetical protein
LTIVSPRSVGADVSAGAGFVVVREKMDQAQFTLAIRPILRRLLMRPRLACVV